MDGRIEDGDLTTGRGSYVEDLIDETALWAGFVRSQVAHGIVSDVDVSDVEPDVHVFLASDLDLEPQPGKLRASLPGHVDYRRPVLADEVVRFAGEAVALVVADSEERVTRAIDSIWVDVDELPATVTTGDAALDAIVLHPKVGTNRAVHASHATADEPTWGDPARIEIEIEVDSPRIAPAPMEPLSILVAPDGDGFSVACGTQTPHRLRAAIAASLGLEPEAIRVAIPYVGGAFGQKGAVYVEYLAIARAAQLLGRPVAWIQRRRDNLMSATHGRGQHHRVRLGGQPDGTLTDGEVTIVGDLGAYPQMGGVVPVTTASLASGPYRFERFSVSATGVLTNLTPTGPYRGAGRPEATYALERAIDAFAREAGVPAHVVRRRSLLESHHDGAVSATGLEYDSGDYRGALDIALEAIDLESVHAERASRLAAGERVSVGAAVTCFIERAGGPVEFGECAEVEIEPDGTIGLHVGSAPSGQGHRTVFQGIVADEFDVPTDRIRWIAGDTGAIATGGGTYGSRSGQLGATATLMAVRRLSDRCRRLAAEILGADPSNLVLRSGTVATVDGSASIPLRELAERAGERHLALREFAEFVADSQTFPYGAHAVEVEVDLDTGEVTIRRIVAVDDAGTILNPMIASGQIQGSLAQGVGQAMREQVAVSDDGVLASGTFMDYLLPTASSVPDWELLHLTTPASSNPLGAKGVGESGTIGVPPAIVNAVIDALTPFGVNDLDMPLTPRRVWDALDAAGAT